MTSGHEVMTPAQRQMYLDSVRRFRHMPVSAQVDGDYFANTGEWVVQCFRRGEWSTVSRHTTEAEAFAKRYRLVDHYAQVGIPQSAR